jgi:hypothetical protein
MLSIVMLGILIFLVKEPRQAGRFAHPAPQQEAI